MAASQARRAPRAGLKGGRHRSYPLAERLAARTVVDAQSGCWNFQGCKVGRNGYGQIMLDGKSGKRGFAHRVAWELAKGPIPSGQSVCHRCDNPRCVNPSHLFIGTQQDNIRDAVRKGRWTVRKLSDDDVARIREMSAAGMQHKAIAKVYTVGRSTISDIVRGFTRTERIGEPIPIDAGQAALDAVLERVPSVDLPIVGEVA